jgi:capsular exopolysaccharide synthesis family protein
MSKQSSAQTTRTAISSLSVGDIGFIELLQVASRHWLLLAGGLLLGWGAAVAYYFLAPAQYESTAQILVMRKDPRLATGGVQGAREEESKVSEDLLATHMQVVQSKRIVFQSLERDGLDQLASIHAQLSTDETPTDYVIDNLLVSRGGTGQAKSAHVLNIAFRHSSDEECRRIVHSIVQTYQSFLAEKFQDVNKEAAELIDRAQNQLRDELRIAEANYQTFREKTPLLFNGDQVTNIHRARYDQIQQELSDLEVMSTEARSRLEVVERAVREQEINGATNLERLALIDEKNTQRIGILVSVDKGEADTAEFQSRQPERMASANAEYSELLALLAKERTLLEDYGPNHPEVKNTRQQISLTQQFLAEKAERMGDVPKEELLNPKELVDAYVQVLRHDVLSLDGRRRELEQLAAKEESEAKLLVSLELAGETLRKDMSRKQELFDAVVDRLREINLAKDYGGFINEIIAQPELGVKVTPHLLICLAVGTFFGLVLGSSGAALAEVRDRSFRSPEEIGATLRLSILSHIPELRMLSDSKLAATISATGSQLEPTLLAFHRPKSREAEVFRGLRTSLFFSAHAKNVKVIQCTSANQGDGKTTMIANLAVSFAQSGKRVLLVDCDLRRPRIHTMFGLSNEIGLSGVVSGESEPWDAVQATEAANLWVLPCGCVPSNPAELLTSEMFEKFLALARERYDYVLLDTPPVLAVADPCIVAPRVEGVMLVVRVSNDTRPQVVRAKDMLESVGATMIGTIVNATGAGAHFGSRRYGYGRQYGYGYGYGEGSANDYYSTDSGPGKPGKVLVTTPSPTESEHVL